MVPPEEIALSIVLPLLLTAEGVVLGMALEALEDLAL
jgi:hypothetical protein